MTAAGELTVRILGCGSSGGVPRVGGDWGACDPANPKNRRRRCSILVQAQRRDADAPTQLLIDTSPDMREQLLDANVDRIDAVLMTHEHADQCHGMDDLRALVIRHRRQMPVYMDTRTAGILMHRFDYCFEGKGGYPPILDARLELADGRRTLVDGPGGAVAVDVIVQDHGAIPSLGFRFGPLAYCNDVKRLPEAAFDTLAGVETLIVDALRHTAHPTHASVSDALGWIERIKPRRAILTNLHVDLDYDALRRELPPGVEPAFDGMEIRSDFDG